MFMHTTPLLALLLISACALPPAAALYDTFWSTGTTPGDRYQPPTACKNGCALWANLSADGNTRDQAAVNAKFRYGAVPPEAARLCAMPAVDPGEGPWCYCRQSNDASWGYCGEPVLPTPEQINLQYESDSAYFVSFTTFSSTGLEEHDPAPPVCELTEASSGTTTTLSGLTHVYVDPGAPSMVHYISFVRLPNLKPAATYTYRVKSGAVGALWSSVYSFTTRDYTVGAVQYSVFGDMGVYPYNNMELLEADVDANRTSLVIHLGDHAYQMSSTEGTGTRGDHYMNEWERVLTRVPMAFTMGNHEYYNNAFFWRYLNQTAGLAMGAGRNSGSNSGRYYSIDHGLVHLVVLDFNVYYGLDAPFRNQQLAWLKQDLAAAAAPAQRARVPWIHVMAHMPMYCSSITYDGEYVDPADALRTDVPPFRGCIGTGVTNVEATRLDIEPLMLQYGVDLFTCGHEHNYEVLYPTKHDKATSTNYTNPTAPVHIVTGSGGAPTLDLFGGPGPWTRTQQSIWGYSRITVHNHTHLTQTFVANFMCAASCQNPPCPACPWPPGGVVDEFTIVQQSHGPFQ